MRADVVKMYKDVHTWVGIFSGLCLLIAFYAGAITMFEGPLKQWASPPPELAAPVALSDTQALVDATLATNPDAARGYTIHVETGPDTPARMSWVVWPEGRTRGAPSFTYYSSFDEAGALQIAQDETSEVAEFVDILHRQVGLPFNAHISNIVMGVVAMLYAVAIVSGLIVLLPSLVKDLFELRMGKNLKRMWLDTHNVLGLFSLPFHIIMALTALGFAFHDQVYDIQNKTIWDGRLGEMFEVGTPVHHADILEGQAFLPADQMVARVNAQVPEYQVKRLNYHFNRDNTVEVMVDGERDGYAHRGPDYGIMAGMPILAILCRRNICPAIRARMMQPSPASSRCISAISAVRLCVGPMSFWALLAPSCSTPETCSGLRADANARARAIRMSPNRSRQS